MKTVGIIGSGIAGLACAVRLRAAGYGVEVFEANDHPGGKLSEIRAGGFRFDAGPSLFTMPQMIEELFQLSGRRPEAYFGYSRKEVICKYFYEDGTRFTAYGKMERYAAECEKVFDVSKENILSYFKANQAKYDLTASLFLEKSLHKIHTYLSGETIKAILNLRRLDIFYTMSEVHRKHFKDERLQQLFNRYATYNGSSPYKAPGIMSMIPHLEHHFGTFYPKGGMISIAGCIYRLAMDMGVKFNFRCPVDRIGIEGRSATGVEVKNRFISFDIVISNMDIVPTYRKLLNMKKMPEKILTRERSSSAMIFYWGIEGEFQELDLHNIFFSKDYKGEFRSIFEENHVPDDLTVYINISSKQDSGDAPEGHENWFVMVNVPGNKGQDWDKIIARTRSNIIEKLSRQLGVNIGERIVCESLLDPRAIEARTQSFQGSLYGAASNDRFSAFLRHPNFTKSLQNLYFCGGSVHPGGGIPLCLLSAKITADIIIAGHHLQ